MARLKDNDIAERREASARAKNAMLEQFRPRPAASQPAGVERHAERPAVIEAREVAKRTKKEHQAVERRARELEAAQLATAQEKPRRPISSARLMRPSAWASHDLIVIFDPTYMETRRLWVCPSSGRRTCPARP